MNELTFEERNLVCIYKESGTRAAVIAALSEVRGYLDDADMLALTDSAIRKLEAMSDTEYDALDLFPDYETEGDAYAD